MGLYSREGKREQKLPVFFKEEKKNFNFKREVVICCEDICKFGLKNLSKFTKKISKTPLPDFL